MLSPVRRIPAQTSSSFILRTGESLLVTDPEGQQVSDLFCVSLENPTETLSAGRSIDENETIRLTTGHVLFSHLGNPMLEIELDTCGVHDFLVTPCSLKMFHQLMGSTEHHPSCSENLAQALGIHGIPEHSISTAFNIFMNVEVNSNGRIEIKKPKSVAGDSIRFRARMDLIVALTACSHEGTNAGRCKPIDFQIIGTCDV